MMFNLDQGITHVKEQAANMRKQGQETNAAQYDQIACWLMELRKRRSQEPKPQTGLRTV